MYSVLRDAFNNKKPVLIGRNGSIELAALLQPQSIIPEILERHCGVWPRTMISEWRRSYIEANKLCDVVAAGWYAPLAAYELEMLKRINPDVVVAPLRALEPYYSPSNERWTELLRGRRIAVVSSFAATMQKQVEKRELIWGLNKDTLLPAAEYTFIRTGYAPLTAGSSRTTAWPDNITSWKDAVQSIIHQISLAKADVALIGCGGLSMIIGAELKKMGITSIVMGGAIQVLFGIKGNRWQNHNVISKLWNDNWVYPSAEETPEQNSAIEGSCYWK